MLAEPGTNLVDHRRQGDAGPGRRQHVRRHSWTSPKASSALTNGSGLGGRRGDQRHHGPLRARSSRSRATCRSATSSSASTAAAWPSTPASTTTPARCGWSTRPPASPQTVTWGTSGTRTSIWYDYNNYNAVMVDDADDKLTFNGVLNMQRDEVQVRQGHAGIRRHDRQRPGQQPDPVRLRRHAAVEQDGRRRGPAGRTSASVVGDDFGGDNADVLAARQRQPDPQPRPTRDRARSRSGPPACWDLQRQDPDAGLQRHGDAAVPDAGASPTPATSTSTAAR